MKLALASSAPVSSPAAAAAVSPPGGPRGDSRHGILARVGRSLRDRASTPPGGTAPGGLTPPRPAPAPSTGRGVHPLARRALRGLGPVDEAPALDLHAGAWFGVEAPQPAPPELKALLARTLWQDSLRRVPGAALAPPLAPVTDEHCLLVGGGAAGLDAVVRAFGEPRLDRVCLVTPAPERTRQLLRQHELEVEEVPLRGPSWDRLDVDRLTHGNAKLIHLSDPNAVVGRRLEPAAVEALLRETDALVVLDEALVELSDAPSALLLVTAFPNLIVIRHLSPAWGLGGEPLAVLFAHPLVIQTLRHVVAPPLRTTSAWAELEALLSDPTPAEIWEEIRAERARLTPLLEALPVVRRVSPGDDLSWVLHLFDADAARGQVERAGLPCEVLDDDEGGALRVPLGPPAAGDALLAALRR